MKITHNIFDYATSELSQDAVICWILSFYNDKTSKLYNLAKDLLSSFIELSSKDDVIEIKKQFYKTDILIYLPNTQRVVIIEDKVYTSEHNEQMSAYVDVISKDKKYKDCKIFVVYFKTGFYYDNDKLVEFKCREKFDNFKSIHGKYFWEILQKYKNIDATLDMYIENLDNLIAWYDTNGKFCNKNDKNEWFVSKEYIAQYNLMRRIFPENKWNKKDEDKKYMVYSGSSFGRPWTEMKILKGEKYSIFWRIDTDNKGAYLSLRYYNKYDKGNAEEVGKHIAEYQKYYKYVKDAVKEVCNNDVVENKYYEFSKQENYFEATLLHRHIEDILSKRDEDIAKFFDEIQNITDKFIEYTIKQL